MIEFKQDGNIPEKRNNALVLNTDYFGSTASFYHKISIRRHGRYVVDIEPFIKRGDNFGTCQGADIGLVRETVQRCFDLEILHVGRKQLETDEQEKHQNTDYEGKTPPRHALLVPAVLHMQTLLEDRHQPDAAKRIS
jgi:hypothetical protein